MRLKVISEKAFQARVTRALKTLKQAWFYKASDRVKNGIPDIICCIDGVFVALELKRSINSKPTPLQTYTLEQIRDASGIALVVYPENWREVFDRLVMLAGGTIVQTNGEANDKTHLPTSQRSGI